MRILFLSQYFPPEMGAPAARVSELATAWAKAGQDVTVLTGLPNHPTGVVPPQYRGRPWFRERHDGFSVVRVWLLAAPNEGFARRSLLFASYLASSVSLGAALTPRPDVLVATSPQLLVGAAGLVLSRLKRVPFVLEVRDLWPRTAVELGALRNRRVIAALERLERRLYRSARLIAIVSEEFRAHIEAAGVPPERILFVPNGYDPGGALAQAAPAPPEARRREGVMMVAYVGTHGMSQALSSIVRVAERFTSDPRVRFLFVGAGAEKQRIVDQARASGLTNCTFLDPVPREVVASIYREADVCLVPLRDLPVFATVLPSKLFEIMALGRPVLASVCGRAAQLVQESEAGIAVPPEDVDALVAAIERLRDEPSLRERLGNNGPRFIARSFDRRALAARYLEALRRVVAEA